MKRSHLLAGTCLSLALVLSASATAQDAPRYQQWGGGGSTQDMVDALRDLVGEAERARAADPRFLGDLKALADAFDQTAPVALITDDFRDGDYTNGTVWTVTGGRWWVEEAVGLRSLVAAPAAAPAASDPPPSNSTRRRVGDDFAEAILSDILNQVTRPRSESESGSSEPQTSPAATSGDATPAEIQVAGAIPNAFAARLEITSREPRGALRLGPYQVSTRDGWGYYLAYHPGDQTGMRLVRFSRGQPTVIGSHNGTIGLEDGRLHVIEWTRSVAGTMTVSLDGKVMIQATDTRLRDPFDGFAISNQGGDYAVRNISISRAQ